MQKLITKCVNAHDRCNGGSCPYCEPVVPLRSEDGRFVKVEGLKQIVDSCATFKTTHK